MVECVEELGAELEALVLGDAKLAEDAKINYVQAWTLKDRPPSIAERVERLRYEGSGVEPPLQRAFICRQIAVCDAVDPVITLPVATKVGWRGHGEVEAALDGDESRELPAGDQTPNEAIALTEEPLTGAERQVVDIIGGEAPFGVVS